MIADIKAKGIFRSATECSFAGRKEIAKEMLAAEKRGEIDILGEILNEDSGCWDDNGQYQFEGFIGELLQGDVDYSPSRIIDVCVKVLNAPSFNQEASMLPRVLGAYLGRQPEKSLAFAEIVLSDSKCAYFIPQVVSIAICLDPETWLQRLFSYVDNDVAPIQKACGFAALSFVEENFVEDFGGAKDVYDFLAKFVFNPPYGSFAVALYNACATWSINRVDGSKFNDLRDELIKFKDKVIVNISALTERNEVQSIRERSLSVRISVFSESLMSEKGYVRSIDGYFKKVYEVYPEKLQSALEDVLINGDGVIYKDGFLDDTFKAIALGDAKQKNRLITRWLASDKPELWRAVQKVMSSANRDQDLGIRVCVDELPKDDAGKINVLRRAVGRMFDSYATCIGYAVSCLKFLSDDSLSFVDSMFYMVLTLNFPDIVLKAKESLAQDEGVDQRVVAFLTAQIAQWAKLDAALKSVKEIRELLPPIKHRIEFWRVESKKQQEFRRELNKNSFLSSFPELPVLYGNGTIYKQYTAKGENRVAAPFSKIEARVRIPSMLRFGEMVLQKELDDLIHLPVVAQ